ncbi:MAG: adenylate kinase [Thermoleophilia bacterium]|nr:adenylate kinase [Thermoleophilia bacterium]
MRRVVVVTSASGSGGTTFGRALAERLDVPFHELDALFWQPSWTESPADEFRARVEPVVATESWVIDGSYQSLLGDLPLRNADTVVWLDLPLRVWLPRLMRRTLSRVIRREELWAGNRESLRNTFLSRDSLILFALRHYPGRRRRYPERFAAYDLVRLRSSAEMEHYLRSVERGT